MIKLILNLLSQGLSFKDSNTLIESAGLYGESAIQYIDVNTMDIIKSQKLDPKYFGEGCEVVVNENNEVEIYQLTWREGKMFTPLISITQTFRLVWDGENLALKREIDLPEGIREGWGISKRYVTGRNGQQILNFYITEGSNKIYVVDSETWRVKRIIQVKLFMIRPFTTISSG